MIERSQRPSFAFSQLDVLPRLRLADAKAFDRDEPTGILGHALFGLVPASGRDVLVPLLLKGLLPSSCGRRRVTVVASLERLALRAFAELAEKGVAAAFDLLFLGCWRGRAHAIPSPRRV